MFFEAGPPFAMRGHNHTNDPLGNQRSKSVMLENNAHPNTQAIIEAWKRLSGGEGQRISGPMADDFPGLVGRLFILQKIDKSDFSFRVAGAALEDILDRELADHNFMSLWRSEDKPLISAAIDAALLANSPSIVYAVGMTLDGRTVNVEIALAPLGEASGRRRLLGLYQTLTDETVLNGRPVWRHWATSIVPPITQQPLAPIRLVASNTH